MKKNLILDSKLKHFILKIILTMSEADNAGVLNYEILKKFGKGTKLSGKDI